MEPVRNFLRHKKRAVKFYEAEATKIDYERKVVLINDDSEIKGDVCQTEVPFDMLVVGVGAENATFGRIFPFSLIILDCAYLNLSSSNPSRRYPWCPRAWPFPQRGWRCQGH